MKLLLDECLPARFACDLIGHEISTIDDAGFKGLENGDLLAVAGERFDVLITIDKGIEYQQNLKKLPISILLLQSRSNRLEHLQQFVPVVQEALSKISPGEFIKLEI